MSKYLIPFLLILSIVAGLWLTRPAAVIAKCETINSAEMCDILNKE